MTFAQEKRLAQMTADGVFTTSELVDMLSNPNKKKGYFYIGLQRTGGSVPAPQPVRKPAPVAPAWIFFRMSQCSFQNSFVHNIYI